MTKRLSWFGHVQWTDDDNIAKSVLNTQIERSRPRGRPKLRWSELLKQDMKQNKVRPEWASDRERGLVQNDENRQPYPGNDGKVRKVRNNFIEN